MPPCSCLQGVREEGGVAGHHWHRRWWLLSLLQVEHPVGCAQHHSAAAQLNRPAPPPQPHHPRQTPASRAAPQHPAPAGGSAATAAPSCWQSTPAQSGQRCRGCSAASWPRRTCAWQVEAGSWGGWQGSAVGVAVLLQQFYMPPGQCLPCSTAPPTQPSSSWPHRCTKFCSLPTASTRRMAASVGAGGG